MNRIELIAAVREHALANYEQGWDVVVEAWEDDEIATVIGKARTANGAIKRMAKAIEPYNERRQEIEALADYDRPEESAADENPVPETYIQDIIEAEAQAHRIADAITTGIVSAEKHAETFPAWEEITTESGAVFSPNNGILERHILDERCVLAQYLSAGWNLGSDLDLVIGFYRDHAFTLRLMELELARRTQRQESQVPAVSPYPTRHPAPTESGVVCGNCTHRDHNGQRVIVRHATPADVRDCYAARYDEEQAVLAEIEAEKRIERFYEEGF